jgi:hypothetical protein
MQNPISFPPQPWPEEGVFITPIIQAFTHKAILLFLYFCPLIFDPKHMFFLNQKPHSIARFKKS